MALEWRYGNKISKKDITALEDHFGIKYPEDYAELVLNFDGASPTFDCYDIPDGEKEKAFDHLISLSGENIDNVLFTYDI